MCLLLRSALLRLLHPFRLVFPSSILIHTRGTTNLLLLRNMHPRRELSLKNVQGIRALRVKLLVLEVKKRFGIGFMRLYKIWRGQPVFVLLQHTEYAHSKEDDIVARQQTPDAHAANGEEENATNPSGENRKDRRPSKRFKSGGCVSAC